MESKKSEIVIAKNMSQDFCDLHLEIFTILTFSDNNEAGYNHGCDYCLNYAEESIAIYIKVDQ